MGIQVTVLNGPGSIVADSGGSFAFGAGMILQFRDVLPDGSLGEFWDPTQILSVPSGNDLVLTFPNGETVVLTDALLLLAGAALQDRIVGENVQPESELEPAAGTGGGTQPTGGSGSIQAASPFEEDGFGGDFSGSEGSGGEFSGLEDSDDLVESDPETTSSDNPTTASGNRPPNAVDDTAAANADTVLIVTGGAGLRANDSDPDGDPFSITAVNGNPASVGMQVVLASGTLLTVNADGSYIYDPNGRYDVLVAREMTMDRFTYTVSDESGATDTATVTITITGVDDPVDARDDSLLIGEGEVEVSTVAPDFNLFADNGNGRDLDPDGDAFSIIQVSNIVLNGFAGVAITNTPAFGAGPPFSATVEVDNGEATAILTVNADGTANLVAGAGDPFAGLGDAGSGTLAFSYTVLDADGNTDTATATIMVTANDPPVLAGVPSNLFAREGVPTPIGLAGDVVSDPDDSQITVAVTVGAGTVMFEAGGRTFDLSLAAFVGSPADINQALATMRFVGAINAGNTDTITIVANDGSGGVVSQVINVNVVQVPLPLHATVAEEDSGAEILSLSVLEPILAAAVARWSDSGLSPEQEERLADLRVSIADLPGRQLGAGDGEEIVIDVDGAGHGWFVDPTPLEDSEFARVASESQGFDGEAPAAGKFDLLTTVLHEMGHSLGLFDLSDPAEAEALMFALLDPGERRLPAEGQAADLVGIDTALEVIDLLPQSAVDALDGSAKEGLMAPRLVTLQLSEAVLTTIDDGPSEITISA